MSDLSHELILNRTHTSQLVPQCKPSPHLYQLPALPQQVSQTPPRWGIQHIQTQRLQVALLSSAPSQHTLPTTKAAPNCDSGHQTVMQCPSLTLDVLRPSY